jgi:transcriptional regulator with XRE-family HTH domain
MKKSWAGRDFPIPQRIRNRREKMGFAAYEFARRVEISPSYLSLIEKGAKLPSEEIAVRIAEALDDDPEIYLAWIYASRHPDFQSHFGRLMRAARVRSSATLQRRLRRGEDVEAELEQEVPGNILEGKLESASGRRARMARRTAKENRENTVAEARRVEELSLGAGIEKPRVEESSRSIPVPLLPDGSDPGDDPSASPEVLDLLHLDSQILPPEVDAPFAYRPGSESLERVEGAIRPGDLVVLRSAPQSVKPAGTYAVRYQGRILLSRVVRHGTVLLLLPSTSSGHAISIENRDEKDLLGRLAGEVVATIRSWQAAEGVQAPPPKPAPRGRSVRLEGDYLVRDCEWTDGYGWRPIQRPEDMDYLDAHPGTRIRFRLIKDGTVQNLLEMSPDEWREALGRHYKSPGWRKNGYIVAITKRRGGRYTTEFQDRWAPFSRFSADSH